MWKTVKFHESRRGGGGEEVDYPVNSHRKVYCTVSIDYLHILRLKSNGSFYHIFIVFDECKFKIMLEEIQF